VKGSNGPAQNPVKHVIERKTTADQSQRLQELSIGNMKRKDYNNKNIGIK
jgi:hypothetical protein